MSVDKYSIIEYNIRGTMVVAQIHTQLFRIHFMFWRKKCIVLLVEKNLTMGQTSAIIADSR